MPYKDPEKKREFDRERYRREKEKSTRTEPIPKEVGGYSEDDIRELTTITGLSRMLAKHILILDGLPIDQTIRAKAISTLCNTAGRILINSDMEQELQGIREEVEELYQQLRSNKGIV